LARSLTQIRKPIFRLGTKKVGTTVFWTLETDQKLQCRYCGETNLRSGYWCPIDKEICCIDCGEKDNNWEHAKKFLKTRNPEHIHYKVDVVELKEVES